MPLLTEDERAEACHADHCIDHGTGTLGCPIRALERSIRSRAHARGVDLEVLLDG